MFGKVSTTCGAQSRNGVLFYVEHSSKGGICLILSVKAKVCNATAAEHVSK